CRFNLIIYHDKSSDLGQDLLITTAIHLAHLESEQKSKRIRARFTHKRLLEKEGGERRTSMSASWIELSKDKTHFVLIPERARIVRKMVDLKLQGWGAHRITVYLNEQGYPCWNRSKTWY
ncbi:recombinase family protein, partial [Vibrio parahaemolyticus]|uniref:recombinase family protein n=1 Tax=Vibrio parahaemolyticus TaxID=670 RepID=UPI001469F4E1|nr:recombinase family protein [Vibrio parahaemolyticus]